MNRYHRRYCASDRWGALLRDRLLPWTLDRIDLGARVLEIGPGPGRTTELIRARFERLTCAEIDPTLAVPLARRLAGTNVHVAAADGTRLPFADGSFTGAVGFTMLHHVPSAELQDVLLAEVARVLAPAGVFTGWDSEGGVRFRINHLFDTGVPADPATFGERLARAGFSEASVRRAKGVFRFRARKA